MYATQILLGVIMAGMALLIYYVRSLMISFQNFMLLYLLSDECEDEESEMVNHPDHYQQTEGPYAGRECIDVMEELFGPEAVYHFCECNAFKYRFRKGKKDGNSEQQEEAKAKWYDDYAEKIKQKLQ